MSRSSRMFEIIQLLRAADGPLTAEAMAGTLEVTKRTVYRDIAALQAMRVPIDGEAGVGYVMRPGFDLPPLMFTAEEVEAIVVGLALLGRTGDGGLVAAAERAGHKISEVLPGDIIATGTPAGVGYAMTPARALQAGDLVVARIDRIGELRNRFGRNRFGRFTNFLHTIESPPSSTSAERRIADRTNRAWRTTPALLQTLCRAGDSP